MTDGTLTHVDGIIKNIYGAENPAVIQVVSRTPWQTFKRTFKRSGKIIGAVLLVSPIAIFVHLLLLLSLFAVLIATGLFVWGLGDRQTFENVDGVCPTCKVRRYLKPFGSSRLNYPLTVHCQDCGGTFTAIQKEPT